MTPFGQSLEKIRRDRGLKQFELADLIDIKASYVSVLERGHKGPPSKFIIRKIIEKLQLTEEEKQTLLHDAEISAYTFTIPYGISRSEFELLHQLKNELGSLNENQILIMKTVLSMRIERERA
ncbi:transcriptional regulator with XRE-family HTH domain [Rheinheimera pacifica]|uniref:helix-turn-helix domain-containing protein n=1 Tax=Rheinheimera pacifica TaxID=173990 RepID=UPI002167C383|nr:helix-turn-helix transcriptional regulator [Rheinheimera pacifica]MCS4309671.1 transcriptional regulator with XRE-family HTH domain [Rheinheimera pacifica]